MTLIERAVVGRKTRGDGKLEVSSALAEALGGDGTQIEVRVASNEVHGHVTAMQCTCAKAGALGKHQHHFVQCDAFRDLPVGSELRLSARHARIDVVLGA